MHFSIDRTVHTTAFDKPVVDHWLERNIFTETDTNVVQLIGDGRVSNIFTETDTNER